MDKVYLEKKRIQKSLIERVKSRSPRKVLMKSENYALFSNEYFGNRVLSWDSYLEIVNSGYRKMVSMRSKKGIDRKEVEYNVPFCKIKNKIMEWEKKGVDQKHIAFNQAMPDEHLIIQGELTSFFSNEVGGWYLWYSLIKKPMNIALAEEAKLATGLKARNLLKGAMDWSSFSDMELLMEIYPESVIEFSTYDILVGNIPNRNSVIWEVRDY